MSNPRAKCIGGPFDGRWKEYIPDRQWMEFAAPRDLTSITAWAPDLPPVSVEVTLRICRYRREQFHCPEEVFTLLVFEDIPVHEAMRLLLTHYNPPIESGAVRRSGEG